VCRGYYTPDPGPGRNGRYCSTVCRTQRNHDLERAIRELAQGRAPKPADAADALRRAEVLASVWLTHDHRGPCGLRAELIDLYWLGERPPTRLSLAPDPRAVRALLARVAELRQLAATHERERRRQQDEQREAARAQRDRETKRQARAADAEWRRELLTSGGTA